MKKIVFFILVSFHLQAFVVGNPADPNLYRSGIFIAGKHHVNFRVGYVSDYTYKMNLKDEFIKDDPDSSYIGLSTYAALLALNFWNLIDIYSILGSTRISDDQIGYASRKFSWCVGSKIVFYRNALFHIGGDIKYFTTKQKPAFYVLEDGVPGFITSQFHLCYHEIQAALAMSFTFFKVFIPYIGATYLDARLEPTPHEGSLDIPAWDMDYIFNARSSVNKNNWGMIVGVTLLAGKMATLSVESRMFDQKDVNVIGEIRF